MFTEPQKGVFDYTEGEVVAKLAAETGKSLRCHALVWHSQLSPWFTATNWTADALREALISHVTNVATHWKGRCYAWDVVNEALDEDGSYRKSVFYNVLGPEFIKIAFKAAAAADPTTKLYYNDYGIERPNNKSEGVKRIVKLLQDDGIRIDGVGLQAHLHAETHPTAAEHIAVMKSYAALGVDVAVTELDVRILLPITAANLAGQTESYQNVSSAAKRGWSPKRPADPRPRSLPPASRSSSAWASPSGTSMTPSAGCRSLSPVRTTPCCGSPTSPSTPPTTASSRRSRRWRARMPGGRRSCESRR